MSVNELSEALILANNEKAEVMTQLDTAQFQLKNLQHTQPPSTHNHLPQVNSTAVPESSSSLPQTPASPSSPNSQSRSRSSSPSKQPIENNALLIENKQLAQILADEKMSSAQLQEQIDNLQNNLNKYVARCQELETNLAQQSTPLPDRSESRASNLSLYQENSANEGLIQQLVVEGV